jgi:hypothetical protein
MLTEEKRRRVVAAALAWTKGTAIAPNSYEEWLLEEYACGRLSIERVISVLDSLSKAQLGKDRRNWSR